MERSLVKEVVLTEPFTERTRRWRTAEEKRHIVEQTLVAGASVSQVARQHGVNANQVFQWRRQYRAGELSVNSDHGARLLPVTVAEDPVAEPRSSDSSSTGSIHVELPGRALISIEPGADRSLVQLVLGSFVR
jgi:transposase